MNRKKISFGFPMLSILLVVGVMFAACGGDDDDDSEAGSSEAGAEPATASDIEGDWQLRSYAESGADDLTAASTASPATATFAADAVNGTTGCNNYNGSYELGDDGDISFGPLATTRMACEGEIQAQEQGVLAGYERARRAVLEDDALQLLDADGNPVLFFAAATSSPTT